jgi:hypothetical protein
MKFVCALNNGWEIQFNQKKHPNFRSPIIADWLFIIMPIGIFPLCRLAFFLWYLAFAKRWHRMAHLFSGRIFSNPVGEQLSVLKRNPGTGSIKNGNFAAGRTE